MGRRKRSGAAVPPGLVLWLLAATFLPARAATLEEVVATEMKAHRLTGVSLAILEHGAISRAQGYGFTDRSGTLPVTTGTLLQAGSVSKPVAALGALSLVEAGRLSLDGAVNRWLKGWKVPENDFTKDEPVTLRRILSHSAGQADNPLPTALVRKLVRARIAEIEKPTQVRSGDKQVHESTTVPLRA